MHCGREIRQELLTDSAVDKVTFNLSANLPAIQATIADFPLVVGGWYNATWQWHLLPCGRIKKYSGSS